MNLASYFSRASVFSIDGYYSLSQRWWCIENFSSDGWRSVQWAFAIMTFLGDNQVFLGAVM